MALENVNENSVRVKLKKQRKRNCIFPSFISKENIYPLKILWEPEPINLY